MRRLLPLLLVALGALAAGVVVTGLPSNVPSDVISGSLTTDAVDRGGTSSVTVVPPRTTETTSTAPRVASTPAPTVASRSTTTSSLATAVSPAPTTLPPTAPTTTIAAAGQLVVVVANAGPADRLAARMATSLAALGYVQTVVTTSSGRRPVSEVYFAPGRDQEAFALASAVGLAATQVHPFPGTQLTVDDARGDLWLVVGNDLLQRIEGVG